MHAHEAVISAQPNAQRLSNSIQLSANTHASNLPTKISSERCPFLTSFAQARAKKIQELEFQAVSESFVAMAFGRSLLIK
jgi:hypothetical protein